MLSKHSARAAAGANLEDRDMFTRMASSAALIAAMAFGHATGAQAQVSGSCGPRAEVLKQLSAKYHETPVAIGVASSGASVLEVVASSDGATWTALVTRANGMSCVVMSGEGWQTHTPQLLVRTPRVQY
jgi:hypothetical protein